MEILKLFGLAFAPVIAIIIFIWFKDKYEKEPFRLLLLSFLFGVLSIIPAIIIELIEGKFIAPTSLVNVIIYSFVVIALSEEFCKFFFLRKVFFRKKSFNEPFDGIVYSVMISMGFAAIENVMYVLNHGVSTAILRMFTAVPAHASFAIMMGYFVGLAKFSNHKNKLSFVGLFVAVVFHGAYDFFLIQNEYNALKILAFVVLIICIILGFIAIKKMQKNKFIQNNSFDNNIKI